MNVIFAIFPVLFLLVFLTIIGVFISSIVATAKRNSYNNRQPVLTVSSRVLSRRTNMSHHDTPSQNGMHHSHIQTTHYATFEVESGDRMEFQLPDREYGLLMEGDYGKLTFQGTRFMGFIRDQQPFGWNPAQGPAGMQVPPSPASPSAQETKSLTYPPS